MQYCWSRSNCFSSCLQYCNNKATHWAVANDIDIHFLPKQKRLFKQYLHGTLFSLSTTLSHPSPQSLYIALIAQKVDRTEDISLIDYRTIIYNPLFSIGVNYLWRRKNSKEATPKYLQNIEGKKPKRSDLAKPPHSQRASPLRLLLHTHRPMQHLTARRTVKTITNQTIHYRTPTIHLVILDSYMDIMDNIFRGMFLIEVINPKVNIQKVSGLLSTVKYWSDLIRQFRVEYARGWVRIGKNSARRFQVQGHRFSLSSWL